MSSPGDDRVEPIGTPISPEELAAARGEDPAGLRPKLERLAREYGLDAVAAEVQAMYRDRGRW
jgi:hypothetical protein